MSENLERQVREDRATRDRALALFKSDLANLKSDYAHKSIKERATDKLKTGAGGILDEAKEVASEHRGPLIALVAALALWFARHPLISLITGRKPDDHDGDAHDESSDGGIFAMGRRD